MGDVIDFQKKQMAMVLKTRLQPLDSQLHRNGKCFCGDFARFRIAVYCLRSEVKTILVLSCGNRACIQRARRQARSRTKRMIEKRLVSARQSEK
jgi:hypothetical protein